MASTLTKCRARLFAQAKAFDCLPVFIEVAPFEVVEHAPTTTDHLHQTAAAVMIVAMGFEMLGKLVDPAGKQSDLNFRGAGIGLVFAVIADDLGFDFDSLGQGVLLCAAPGSCEWQ
jgi:hypothetical protein